MAHLIIVDSPIPSLTFQVSNSINDNSGTHSYTGIAFGSPHPTRAIIVTIGYGNIANVTGVTIGGIAATRLATVTSSNNYQQIWIASVPTGTSGTVVIPNPDPGRTYSSCIGVYSALYLRSQTPTDAATDTGTSSTSTSVSVQANGIIISAVNGFANTPLSTSWTNATEDFQTTFGTGFGQGQQESGASYQSPSTTTRTTTATLSPARPTAMATASFR